MLKQQRRWRGKITEVSACEAPKYLPGAGNDEWSDEAVGLGFWWQVHVMQRSTEGVWKGMSYKVGFLRWDCIRWEMQCWWNFFDGSIYKKIASYRSHASGICEMKASPDPGEGRWRLCPGPGSVCLGEPCWLQLRLNQLRELWKGGLGLCLHWGGGTRNCLSAESWIWAETQQRGSSRAAGGSWDVLQEWIPHSRAAGWGVPHPSVTLLWGTAQDNKPALGRESAAPCACEGSIVSLSAALVADLGRLQPFPKQCKVLEILVPKSLQSESKKTEAVQKKQGQDTFRRMFKMSLIVNNDLPDLGTAPRKSHQTQECNMMTHDSKILCQTPPGSC